jgi:hypothetical protein
MGPGRLLVDTEDFLASFAAADLSPVERALALGAMDDVREDVSAARDELTRQVAAEERSEAMSTANRMLGDPLGELSRARAAQMSADDDVRDLSERLQRAEAKRTRAQEGIEFWAQKSGAVTGSAQRSAPSGVEGAMSRAQEALREERASRKVEARLAQAVRSVGSPKVHESDCEICSAARAAERAVGPGREIAR